MSISKAVVTDVENTVSLRSPADVLLKYYNRICRSKAKPYRKNLELIERCLELNNQDEEDLCKYMSWYCLYKNDQDLEPDFEECMNDYCNYMELSAKGVRELDEEDIKEREKEPMEDEGGVAVEAEGEVASESADIQFDGSLSIEVENDTSTRHSNDPKKKKSNITNKKSVKSEKGSCNNGKANSGSGKSTKEGEALEKTQSPSFEELYDSIIAPGNNMAEIIKDAIFESFQIQYQNLLSDAKKEVLDYVSENYGDRTQVVKVEFDDGRLSQIEDEIVDDKLQEVLNFVVAKEPVYLVGPAGCGKNHICKQIAKILNLPFYFSNAITQEYKLTGFTDANGKYHETQFYKAFKNGGVFLLDEIDASLPDALIILNAAIANGYFDFPAPIGFVEAHPDFYVVAAGNTWGNGADMQYVGRNQLDMASLDRFAVVSLDYSPRVEAALCPNKELQIFLREYRSAIYQNGLMSVVSYRAFKRLYLLENRFENRCDWLDSCLCKGLCKDDLIMIHRQIKTNSKYKDVLGELAYSRRE